MLVELSQQFDVHAHQIKHWKDQLLEGATGVFGDETKVEPAGPTVDVKTLHAKIGELRQENDLYDGLCVNIHFNAPVDFIQSGQTGISGSMLVA